MFKINLFLMGVLLVCALGVVTVQHETRQLRMNLENEKKMARKLKIENDKLQMEQSTLIARRQIEYAAKAHLEMEVPATNQIQLIPVKKPMKSMSGD